MTFDDDPWGEFDAQDDPLRGDDQPPTALADTPGAVTATDRDHQVTAHLRAGRIISLDIDPSALGGPRLADNIMEAVNAALDSSSIAVPMGAQTWKERFNELALLQIRADETITNAIDASRDITRNTERILSQTRLPSPLR